jgi:hypothetical protein
VGGNIGQFGGLRRVVVAAIGMIFAFSTVPNGRAELTRVQITVGRPDDLLLDTPGELVVLG